MKTTIYINVKNEMGDSALLQDMFKGPVPNAGEIIEIGSDRYEVLSIEHGLAGETEIAYVTTKRVS